MMKVDLAAVVLGWDKLLATTDHVLSKGAEFAQENGISEPEMLDWRLAPDMFPLQRQVQIVCTLIQHWSARAAGVEVPPDPKGETVSELKSEIEGARRLLAGIHPEYFNGRDDVSVNVDLGMISPTMPIGQWVLGF